MLKNINNTNVQKHHQHQCAKKWRQHQCVQITPTHLNNTSAFKQHQCVKKQQHQHSKKTTTLAFQNINNIGIPKHQQHQQSRTIATIAQRSNHAQDELNNLAMDNYNDQASKESKQFQFSNLFSFIFSNEEE